MTTEDIPLVAKLARPHTYAEERLGMKLHPNQSAVLKDLFPLKENGQSKQSRVSFLCSNEVGKTSRVGCAAILFALEIKRAQVISTAGVWMQVVDQLVPALKRMSHLFPDWGFNESDINIRGQRRYVGFSTRDEGFAQGFHKDTDRPLLAIIDEAAAVRDVIFDGIEDRCNPDWLLVMGSPLEPQGRFYDIETKYAKFYTHHHLCQTDCLQRAGWWINQESIDRKIARYGKDHPFVQSNVFGEFAAQIENGLMSLKEFNACIASPPQEMRHGDSPLHCWFDVGRNNVCAVRHGNKVWLEKVWYESERQNVPGQIIKVASKLKRDLGLTPEDITVDAGGEDGKEITDDLQTMGWYVRKWYGQQAALDPEYQNSVSEAWINGAKLIKDCDIIIPDNDNFRHQCLTRRKKAHPSGRSQIEPKDEYMKRGFTSPHEADAIFGSMLRLGSVKSVNLSNQKPQDDDRGWVERAYDERAGNETGLPAASCL